jgi:CRP-like cAMP-binding protein
MIIPKSIYMTAEMKSHFLNGLTQPEIDAVLSAATRRQFPAGAVVCHQETPANRLFMLAKGRARFFTLTPDGKKILLFWLPEGEIFGAAALQARSGDYIVSTETIRESTLLIWDKRTIRHLAALYPQLLENSVHLAYQYLTFYVATHVALISHTAPQRLASVLLNLSHGIGHTLPSGIELDVSNEELAQAANITHFTTSRLLSRWHRQGILLKQRGKILLRSPEKLFFDKH